MRLQPTGHGQRKIRRAGRPAAETRRWACAVNRITWGLGLRVKGGCIIKYMARLELSECVQSVRDSYPDLPIRRARLNSFSDGQFNAIVFVNEDDADHSLVFRFPRVEQAIQDMPGEIRLLRALQGHTSIAVPNPIFVSRDLATIGRAFMGYQKLPGEPMYSESVEAIPEKEKRGRLARQLAQFLKGLHALDVSAIGLDLAIEDGRQGWHEMLEDFRKNLFPHMRDDACAVVEERFRVFAESPDSLNYKPSIRHTDFGGGNILFDPKVGNVTGVIDWAGVTLGDPAVDAAAIEHMGEEFYGEMLHEYPAMAEMRPRVRFFQSTYGLQEALNALRDGDQGLFEEAIAQYR